MLASVQDHLRDLLNKILHRYNPLYRVPSFEAKNDIVIGNVNRNYVCR